MDVRINFKIITKNSSADPEIGLHVLVRAFPEGLKKCNHEGSNPCGPSTYPRT